jgi:Spy/CpxP family protein refolding chaperone
MHPAFYSWWKHARRHHAWATGNSCHPGHGAGPSAEGFCGPGRGGDGPGHGHGHGGRQVPGIDPGPGPEGAGGGRFGGRFGGGPPDDGGFFGVRRPLRFLAHKLELSEAQVSVLARILDELKTERAQAEVDNRRTVSAFADALEGAEFGEARAREGADLRVKSAERLRDAVTLALSRIHALLEEEQRKRLSYLIRTGVVSL